MIIILYDSGNNFLLIVMLNVFNSIFLMSS